MRSVRSGNDARPVEVAGEDAVQDVGDERALARPRHAGDGGEAAERHLDGDVLQVVLARALDAQHPPWIARPPLRRQRDGLVAAQVGAGQRLAVPNDLVDGAAGHDLAAVLARPGAEVDEVVGGADGLLVVLDHEHGVAEVAQALERAEQPGVVALVQADARLVEDVQHAHQACADLRGQPDALRLAAGESDSAERLSVMYSRPTSTRKRSRSGTSLRTGPAISGSSPGLPGARSGTDFRNASAPATEQSTSSPRFLPCTVTASDSGLRRAPPHSGHLATSRYSSSSVRTLSLVVSA